MFSAYFPGVLRVLKVRKSLGVFEVFLGIFEKTKEKKDRVQGDFKSAVNLRRKGNSDHGLSFLPGKTQTMVRVNCQDGGGGGSWVGQDFLKTRKKPG